MAKYNTQKYSKGRSANRENIKDSYTMTNNIYLLNQYEEVSFYIDSIFSEDEHGFLGDIGINYKTIYLVNPELNQDDLEEKIPFCFIDDTVAIDCDFMENLNIVYSKTLDTIKIRDIDSDFTQSMELDTLISPSSYDSISNGREGIEGFDGFYFEIGTFDLHNRYDGWAFYGHSQHLSNIDDSNIDIELLKKMNSIQFYIYFQTKLKYM